MKPFTAYAEAKRVGCRHQFSDEYIWRDTLGNKVPLHPFSTTGSLDAPEWIPSGCTGGATLFRPFPYGSF